MRLFNWKYDFVFTGNKVYQFKNGKVMWVIR